MEGHRWHPWCDAVPDDGFETAALGVEIQGRKADNRIDFPGRLAVSVPSIPNAEDEIAPRSVREGRDIGKELPLVVVAIAREELLLLQLPTLADDIRPEGL
jgi:hypothetical protein